MKVSPRLESRHHQAAYAHVLRHTFSILWIHKGASTRALQGSLGHDHLSTTENYLNLAPEQILQEFQNKW
jgi:site-specific recombinase XerD